MLISLIRFALPPSNPFRLTVLRLFFLAHFIALIIFSEFPEDDIVIRQSPCLANLDNWNEKISSYLISFAIAVIISKFDDKEIIFGSKFVFKLVPFKWSQMKWFAIEAEPPFPQTNIFLLDK